MKKLSKYTQPRIAAFVTEGRRQYFVVAEQRVLCEVPSLQDALFYTFASYYIFNLAYAKETEKILFFFQDYIVQTQLAAQVHTFLQHQTLKETFNLHVVLPFPSSVQYLVDSTDVNSCYY